MGNISRHFLTSLHQQLLHFDIERSYYPLLVIESGKGKLIQQELAGLLSCDKVQVLIKGTTALALKELSENKVDELYFSLKIIKNNLTSNKIELLK
jgi:hypothetical protein